MSWAMNGPSLEEKRAQREEYRAEQEAKDDDK